MCNIHDYLHRSVLASKFRNRGINCGWPSFTLAMDYLDYIEEPLLVE